MTFLQAALRQAVVVRECASELALVQADQRERAMPFFQLVLRLVWMVAVNPFFPPKDA